MQEQCWTSSTAKPDDSFAGASPSSYIKPSGLNPPFDFTTGTYAPAVLAWHVPSTWPSEGIVLTGPDMRTFAVRELVLGALVRYLTSRLIGSVTLGSLGKTMSPVLPWDAFIDIFDVAPRRPSIPANIASLSASEKTRTSEARLAQAENQWRTLFRRRSAVMKQMLSRSSEDLPTPLTDGDD